MLGDLNRETRPNKELTKLMSDMESKHGEKNNCAIMFQWVNY